MNEQLGPLLSGGLDKTRHSVKGRVCQVPDELLGIRIGSAKLLEICKAEDKETVLKSSEQQSSAKDIS
ncbi:hypothetical protein NW761_003521 [Fusarium oxysporum]|nr:hypothetical protein NW758_001301 [Fusarium oxysporum]KAJ4100536.1 hypothetical protein NW761_003521 [Fusarium oxysporum]